MPESYWIIKQNPSAYAWKDLVKDKVTQWTGARTVEARDSVAKMKKGDQVLFYHSGSEKAIVGIVTVARQPHADQDSPGAKLVAVNLKPVSPLGIPVTLSSLEGEPSLSKIFSALKSRASVIHISNKDFNAIVARGDVIRLLQDSIKSYKKPGKRRSVKKR